jgi:PAS domain S-box-containing protein
MACESHSTIEEYGDLDRQYYETRYNPIYNDKREIIGATAFASNVTQRIRLEESLKKSEDMLNSFFEQSMAGSFFMMIDKPVEWNDSVDKEKTLDYVFSHQHVIKVNLAMLDQYKAKEEEFIRKTPNDFFAHDLAQGRKTWTQLFDKGHLHIDTDERKVDGSQMWILGDYICLYDSEGRITGHIGVQIDITDLKQVENALKAKAEELERFNKLMLGRELKMIELKKEINELLKEAGKQEKYKIPE